MADDKGLDPEIVEGIPYAYVFKLVEESSNYASHPIAGETLFETIARHSDAERLTTIANEETKLLKKVVYAKNITLCEDLLSNHSSLKLDVQKLIKDEKVPKDICETLNLCKDCTFNTSIASRYSVIKNRDVLVDSMCTGLIKYIVSKADRIQTVVSKFKKSVNTERILFIERLRFCGDIEGFTLLLTRKILKRAIGLSLDITIINSCIDLLLKPLPNNVSKEVFNETPMLKKSDLHLILEEMVIDCADSSALSEEEDAKSFYLLSLLQLLIVNSQISSGFLQRLPEEFLLSTLGFINQNDTIDFTVAWGRGSTRSDIINQINGRIRRVSLYKMAVSTFFNSNFDINSLRDGMALSQPKYDYSLSKKCKWPEMRTLILDRTSTFFKEIEGALNDHDELTYYGPPARCRHEFVRACVVASCTSELEIRRGLLFTLEQLAQHGVVTEDDLQIGLERVFSRLNDLSLDHPEFEINFSRLVFMLICGNFVSWDIVLSWIRLMTDCELSSRILRRCLIWIDKKPSSKRWEMDVVIGDNALHPFDNPEEAKRLMKSVSEILLLKAHGLISKNRMIHQLEVNCNVRPSSAYHISQNIVSHMLLVPSCVICNETMYEICLELLQMMITRKHCNDETLKNVIEEAAQHDIGINNIGGSVYLFDAKRLESSDRDVILNRISQDLRLL